MNFDKLLVNGTIITPFGRYQGVIGIKNGKIACIAEEQADYKAAEVIDVSGKYILPGVIDGHNHFQDPGFTQREDIGHATAACAAGGITTAISHPMNVPAIVDLESYKANMQAYEHRSIIDYGIHGGGTADNIERIEELWQKTGATSIKMFMCFSVKEFPYVRDDALYAILEKLSKYHGLAMLHCENDDLIKLMEKRMQAVGRKDPLAYNLSRPEIAEIEAIRRAIFMLEETGAEGLILHVTSAEALREIKKARQRGVRVWAESCPHYFTFIREDMNELGPYLKFSPVMRDEENRLEMWRLLNEGYVHTIGSDHSPYTREEKEAGKDDIWKAPNGIPGNQIMLSVFLDGVNKGLVSLERIVEVSSYNPAKIYGLYPRKGVIQLGADADLTIVDMALEKTYTAEISNSKANWSPYFGRKFKGWPIMTLVRGEVVYNNGQIMVEAGYGKYVARQK
jgi:D-hydantoinase